MSTNNTLENSTKKQTPLLLAKEISHNFDYKLFDEINLILNKKESIAIIGVSGSGKSTLLNIFSSLLSPIKGEVYYNNKSIYDLSKNDLLKIRRDDFGIIFQTHYLFRGFNANENLEISELLSEHKVDNELISSLKIDHIMHQSIGELSGGQQQRLSCARVLTKKPKVIFADEPTGNLDHETAKEVMNVLFDYTYKNDAGLILVTHEEDIAYMCDKVYKLEDYVLKQLK
ncbi:MAG: ATP-binding cassette domain-containing protein [Campylobacterota bacterium]|nr:ATP-binding cassette domain-containing protein [Campylobacterota bacterium]